MARVSYPACLCRTCVCLQEEFENGNVVGLDVTTGEPFDPIMGGVLDNYIVKKQVCVCVCLHRYLQLEFPSAVTSQIKIFTQMCPHSQLPPGRHKDGLVVSCCTI